MYNNYKLINEKVSKLGETIKVGDFIRYADVKNNRFDDKYRGQDIGVVEQIRYYDEHNIHFIVNGTMVESYYVEVVKNSKKEEKEIVITKERNNDKFQEFRRMILENLAVVLKIICGDKFLIHKFDTKDYMDYEPKFVTKEEYAMNMVERDLHEVYNIMTQGYTEVCNGGSMEKMDLTHKYNVCTLVSTEMKNNTQKIKMKDGKKDMLRLTKKDLMEQIRIMRSDLVNGWIDGAVDNCGSYNRVNKDVVSYWGIEKEVCDYELKLKECTLLKTPAFKEKVAKYLENDFDIKSIRIVVGGVFGTAEVLVMVQDKKNGKEKEVCYLWDNNCNYSIHRELEKQYPNARAEFEEKEQQAMFNKGRELVVGLKNAKKEEVAKVLDEVFMNVDMQVNKFDTIGDCLSDARTELGGLVVKRLEEMVQDCLEKDELKRWEESVLEFAMDSMLDITEELYSKMEVVRFKTQGILPEYESFIEGEIHMSVDENKVAIFNENNLKVELDHEKEEVVVYDVVKQLEGQVDLVSYEKSIEKPEKLETPVKKSKKKINKSEDNTMNTINKNALNNRMVKLGEFIKENRDKDEVEKRIKELFPMAMEIDVFEECDNSVFFLVGQEYVGKKPTKKEIEEDGIEVKYVVDTYGLTVNVDILDDSIEISSSIGVDYIDKYNNHYNTSCTVKEIKIETPKEEVVNVDDIVYMEVLEKNIDELIEEYNVISAEIEVINLNKSIGLDLDVDTTEKEKELECILSRILELGSVVRLTYSHRCFMNVPDVDVLFKNMGDAEQFERENENILEVIDIIKMEDRTKITDLEEHMLSILELMDDKEGVGYMYRSTFAVKKEDKYELTSVLEDMWTGLTVYIGNYANVINSKSIEVTDIIEELIKTEKTNELVEKIKDRFENKSNGQEVYVLMHCHNILEVYNNYDDAYNHMTEDVHRLCKEFNSIYDIEIDKYGATMETMSWKIIKKIVK